MKKSNFDAMILGTIGGILFALGMCMALIPEWNAFRQGVVMGGGSRPSGAADHGTGLEKNGEEKSDPPVRQNDRDNTAGDSRGSASWRGNVPDYGMEQYDPGHCDRNCGNCFAFMSDSPYQRIKIKNKNRFWQDSPMDFGKKITGLLFSGIPE